MSTDNLLTSAAAIEESPSSFTTMKKQKKKKIQHQLASTSLDAQKSINQDNDHVEVTNQEEYRCASAVPSMQLAANDEPLEINLPKKKYKKRKITTVESSDDKDIEIMTAEGTISIEDCPVLKKKKKTLDQTQKSKNLEELVTNLKSQFSNCADVEKLNIENGPECSEKKKKKKKKKHKSSPCPNYLDITGINTQPKYDVSHNSGNGILSRDERNSENISNESTQSTNSKSLDQKISLEYCDKEQNHGDLPMKKKKKKKKKRSKTQKLDEQDKNADNKKIINADVSTDIDCVENVQSKKKEKKKKKHSNFGSSLATDSSIDINSEDVFKNVDIKISELIQSELVKIQSDAKENTKSENVHRKRENSTLESCELQNEERNSSESVLKKDNNDTEANKSDAMQHDSDSEEDSLMEPLHIENSDEDTINDPHDKKMESDKSFSYFSTDTRRRKSIFLDSILKAKPSHHNDTVEKDIDYKELVKNLVIEIKDEEELKNSTQIVKVPPIVMPWSVSSPLHKILDRPFSNPTPQQLQKMKESGVDIKQGPFTKTEDAIIKRNFKTLCRLHDVPEDPKPFLFAQKGSAYEFTQNERLKFVRFLAHDLDNRPLHSVYKRFKRLYTENFKSGRFSPHEDSIIIEYMKQSNSSFPFLELSKILKRDKLAIEKRYNILKSKDADITINWDEENIKKLVTYLLKYTKCQSIEDLRDKKISSRKWTKVSKKFNIPSSKLRKAWKCSIYHKLFADHETYFEVKKKLVDLLAQSDYNDYRSIKWDEVAQNFSGFTGEKLNKLFKNLVSYCVPDDIQPNMRLTVLYLKEESLKRCRFRRHWIKKLNIE